VENHLYKFIVHLKPLALVEVIIFYMFVYILNFNGSMLNSSYILITGNYWNYLTAQMKSFIFSKGSIWVI